MIRTIAEIGINHNGCFKTAINLQEQAAAAGCWAVKYQIRTNFHACTPRHLWDTTRRWHGEDMPYLEYRRRLEFDDKQLRELYDHAQSLGLEWFASPWDVESVGRLAAIERDYCKVASAMVTNEPLLRAIARADFGTTLLSSGMSDEWEVRSAYEVLWGGRRRMVVMTCTSVYPCPPHLLNLARIGQFGYACETGYSGHETGILPSLYAAVLGATYIERHLTLAKSAEGSDHAASLEPHEMRELCDRLAEIPAILGSGEIRPLPDERSAMEKLRGLEVNCGAAR